MRSMSHPQRTTHGILNRHVNRRWQFTGVIVGLVIGLAVGAGVARAQAITGFFTTQLASEVPFEYSSWYVGGMYDMLAEVVSVKANIEILRQKYYCLQAKSHPDPDALARWARAQWMAERQSYPAVAAPEFFLVRACEP
jgi:hypothetical protein